MYNVTTMQQASTVYSVTTTQQTDSTSHLQKHQVHQPVCPVTMQIHELAIFNVKG